MTLAAQGHYKIEAQGNILLVDAHGPFCDETTELYLQDMYQACETYSGQPWGLLATFYGKSVFTPDAEDALVKITKFRVERGMIANASIIIDSRTADIQQMQLRRVYQQCGITFHVFSDIDSAREWLEGFIEQETKKLGKRA